jgi:NADH dehydrogenase
MTDLDAVTGASGYSGKYIARRLLAKGRQVLTLTGHPERPLPFDQPVTVRPYDFDRPDLLAGSLEGVDTLYNTYWVRFPYGEMTHERAVANSRALFEAAQQAGVRRVVHVSITNPSEDSPLPYFKGKARLEKALIESGLSYAILRPAVLFGGESGEDILLNNIAWLLRRFPAFAVPGRGRYRLQPIHVEDLAGLAVEAGKGDENAIVDAVGPETYAFADLVYLIKRQVGSEALIVYTPPQVAYLLSQAISQLVGDVLLTQDEVAGLMGDLLISKEAPTGQTQLSAWLAANADQIGVEYASEVARHFAR